MWHHARPPFPIVVRGRLLSEEVGTFGGGGYLGARFSLSAVPNFAPTYQLRERRARST
ncbi:MAG TPA: hypothetical protein VEJ84_03455 [Acidimicrobiales bacterium]|nr:hypothetical protein [Acidimicrobiales bacterium]